MVSDPSGTPTEAAPQHPHVSEPAPSSPHVSPEDLSKFDPRRRISVFVVESDMKVRVAFPDVLSDVSVRISGSLQPSLHGPLDDQHQHQLEPEIQGAFRDIVVLCLPFHTVSVSSSYCRQS